MKIGFFMTLAWTGIRKNRKLYLPYIFTCAGMVMMEYIVDAVAYSPALALMPGAETLFTMLRFGAWIVALFSLVFLFYTHSFLIRRRKREFALYNILGMDKRNIGRILLWETLIVGAVSLAGGLLGGMLFSKLAELLLSNMMNVGVTYRLTVSPEAIGFTSAVFAGIFALILASSYTRVRVGKPVDLLRGESAGEKPPRVNWLLGILGFVLLGIAYFIAASIEQPIEALLWFFAAVALVILATYCLFVCGSVLLCRVLRQNRAYYYQPRHFVSVSSMAFRMKRNGAGLASVCVLSTMVLVTMLATASLYFGMRNDVNWHYPRDFSVTARLRPETPDDKDAIFALRRNLSKSLSDNGYSPRDELEYRSAEISGLLAGSDFQPDADEAGFALSHLGNLISVYLVPIEDYNRVTDSAVSLAPGEALVARDRVDFSETLLNIGDALSLRVAGEADAWEIRMGETVAVPTLAFFVSDYDETLRPLKALVDSYGRPMLTRAWSYSFSDPAKEEADFSAVRRGISGADNFSLLWFRSRASEYNDSLSGCGGLFFLGILLSAAFLMGTVLIIYYKQITEGYEDQSRFEIMQKVGMTKRDIRASVNSQMLIVFFLPLGFAFLHTAFAFPIVRKLLMLFDFMNLRVMLVTGGVSALAFAAFYALVYWLTSNAYFAIVSGDSASR